MDLLHVSPKHLICIWTEFLYHIKRKISFYLDIIKTAWFTTQFVFHGLASIRHDVNTILSYCVVNESIVVKLFYTYTTYSKFIYFTLKRPAILSSPTQYIYIFVNSHGLTPERLTGTYFIIPEKTKGIIVFGRIRTQNIETNTAKHFPQLVNVSGNLALGINNY